MPKQAKLTKAEKAWVKQLQEHLDNCPSDRIAFATSGDCDLTLFDVTRYDEVLQRVERDHDEFRAGAVKCGAAFEEQLTFPNQVEAVAG
ncbi:TPA: hypothetical protein ACGQ50_000816 [Enterobacter cloacae]